MPKATRDVPDLDDSGMNEEIHALCERRDRATVDAFLAHFASGSSEAQADYPYPPFADPPGEDLGSLEAAIAFLLADPSRTYGLYWSGRRSISLHFLSDGSLVAAALRDLNKDIAPQLREFAEYLKARWVVAEGASPPMESGEEIRRAALGRHWAIADGIENWLAPKSASQETER